MIGARTRMLRNSLLTQVGGDVEKHLENWLETSQPIDLAALIDDAAISLLRDAFLNVGGCEGTIWLADQDELHLVAVSNSGNDAKSLIGFRQPVGSGIISMVYAQQQPYCENDIQASVGHDDTLDRKIAKHTTAMIAVPFYFAFGLRGVISCVQLEESEHPDKGFDSADVEHLVKISNVVERLINEHLLSSTLGLSDGG